MDWPPWPNDEPLRQTPFISDGSDVAFRQALAERLGAEWQVEESHARWGFGSRPGEHDWILTGQRDGISWRITAHVAEIDGIEMRWQNGPDDAAPFLEADAAWVRGRDELRLRLPRIKLNYSCVQLLAASGASEPAGFPSAAVLADFMRRTLDLVSAHFGPWTMTVRFEPEGLIGVGELAMHVEVPEVPGASLEVWNNSYSHRTPRCENYRFETVSEGGVLQPHWLTSARPETVRTRLDPHGRARLSWRIYPPAGGVRVMSWRVKVTDSQHRCLIRYVEVPVQAASLFVGFRPPVDDRPELPEGSSWVTSSALEVLEGEAVEAIVCRLDGSPVPGVPLRVRLCRDDETLEMRVTSSNGPTPIKLSVAPGQYRIEGWVQDEAGRTQCGIGEVLVTRPFARFWASYQTEGSGTS